MSHKKALPSQSELDEDFLFGSLLGQDKKPYKVFEAEYSLKQISFYLSEAIGDPLDYAEMIHTIRTAGENDSIKLHLNTPGGNVSTGIQIINAIRESAATVITVLDGEAYSMGAILFLSGDIQQVGDNGQLMFHMYSSGLIGKGNEQLAAVLSAGKSYGKLLENVCSPFLTDDEIEDVLNGRDLWIDSDEVIERLSAIQTLREEEAKVAAKAEREAKKDAEKKAAAKPATRTTTRKTTARKTRKPARKSGTGRKVAAPPVEESAVPAEA